MIVNLLIQPWSLEVTTATNDSVDFIAFGKEQFGQVRTILAGDSGDDCAHG
jgi:hypothetical protein